MNSIMDIDSIDRRQSCKRIGWIDRQNRRDGPIQGHLEIVMVKVILDSDFVRSGATENRVGEKYLVCLVNVISAGKFNQLDFYRLTD